MCRNIKVLFNFEPPATEEEISAAALQYVRKVSGSQKPSQRNQEAFERAVADIARTTSALLAVLESPAPPKNREIEAERSKARSIRRFGA